MAMLETIDAEYERIRQELREATILQNILLPQEAFLDMLRRDLTLDIAQYYKPAAELAGDYLSVRRLPDDRVALITADISGHGIGAALYAFSLHTLLDDRLLQSRPPGEALEQLNGQLYGLMTAGKFATLFLGVVDPATEELRYAAAAAPTPFLLSGEDCCRLDASGVPLGARQESRYETRAASFRRGDLLLLYSDALVETAGAQGTFMREEEIEALLRQQAGREAGVTLKSLLNHLYTKYASRLTDDLSLLACRR